MYIERDRLNIPQNDWAMKRASEIKTLGCTLSFIQVQLKQLPESFLLTELEGVYLRVRLIACCGARWLGVPRWSAECFAGSDTLVSCIFVDGKGGI